VTAAAFYCMSSELYFPGAVGLVNSLRLHGHSEPIYVLDCGLTVEHRELLSREARVVPSPADVPPYLLKTVAPARHPAEVMVLIDVDMVATRPLTPLIERGAEGRVVAFKDNLDRFVPEWGQALGLGPASPRPYVSSGLVVLGGQVGARVLRLWDERQDRVDYGLSWFERDVEEYPFRFLDQDVLNGVLCTSVEPEELGVIDRRLAPSQPYRRLRIRDTKALRCAYRDGTEPFVLHQYLAKPWLEPMYHGIYSQLLSRLWLGDDVALRLPEEEVPLRMRSGLRARAVRKRADLVDLVRWYARDVIPEWIEARLASARGRSGGS
jgi:hypothetical protein